MEFLRPPAMKMVCIQKQQLFSYFYDLLCSNLGRAICNRWDVVGLMFIITPASKYTWFVPAVAQYKWFNSQGSCVGNSAILLFLLQLLLLSDLIFHIFFSTRFPTYICTYTFSPHFFPCLSFFHLICFFYLLQTVSVEPQTQMPHLVAPSFRMWSCNKSHEPSRTQQPCQASSLWTQHKATQTLMKTTFLLAHVIWNDFLMVLLEMNWGQCVGIVSGCKGGKVYPGHLAVALHHFATLWTAEGCHWYSRQVGWIYSLSLAPTVWLKRSSAA